MINRSLIRIKTIQILYSYLLTRSDFKLEEAPAPGESSRDRIFAYSVYLDLITLLLKLSSVPLGPGSGITVDSDVALRKNRVGKAIRDEAALAGLIAANRERLSRFDSCMADILGAVQASAVYGDYKRKRKLQMSDDVKFWSTLFATTLRKHKGIERVLRRDESFSHVGFDAGMKMFLDTLASFDDTCATYRKARTDLDKSLSLAYTLYHSLLMLPVRITDTHEQRLDANKNKYLPTPDDLNPNMRLADNLFVKALRECAPLQEYVDEYPEADPASWRDSDLLMNRLLELITSSEAYREYMETPAGDFTTDAAFWREMMRTVVIPSDELAEALEAKSVYWNDDLAIMSTFVLKTIRRSYASPAAEGEEPDNADDPAQSTGTIALLPKFMNAADENFGVELFEYVVDNRELYRSYIDRFIDTKQWDTERLAYMDIVIMMTAIAEIINYPSIPVPVTLNEYIEIANDYSTPRSGQFINGILFSVIKMLNDEGIISKK
ncbi:MAG: transcription antitermination protein NusB [Muribaculaceae bacterium]|nr:transcription antitermination protein NusB [Muribaculaceae bacterium]